MTTHAELMTPITLDSRQIRVGDNPDAEARLRLLIGATNSHMACFTEVQNNGSTLVTNASTLSAGRIEEVAERCRGDALLTLIEKWRTKVEDGSVSKDSSTEATVDLSTSILARFCEEQRIEFPFPEPANDSHDEVAPQQPAPPTSEDSHRPALA
ncbi:MAG: hypothetical protein QF741_03595 [Candidatus Peribacteraceae bacterium]|nr:hypothetical protein [Candidatus Peribacteraceae bacterium]MDP7454322.1 hypothetical protein [Candidatus Peribacteraceae bacterium]